ncbi:nitroreductase/quinone reductase family protein [Asanoa iriomotensis]|uniref:Nitroreductase n=1 Tax=Asanoa iriomotensis TaxID=234613 RepID=A0ABQ4CG12_9ACTN|nr:nitroreductase/quinone reductase family protein [Asanoa iriomotensis]GIF61712.1 nitroreductase [Asanoa iriomotensis]
MVGLNALVNPVVRLAWALRLPIPGDALLETTGRRTGKRRHTPICDGLDGDVFWLVAVDGRADWVRDLDADPHVRVKVSRGRWRTGTARVLPDDDPVARRRTIGETNLARRLCVTTAALSDNDPVTVRIDLDVT